MEEVFSWSISSMDLINITRHFLKTILGADTMAGNKTSETQARARDKWDAKNKDKKRVYSYRSYSRRFIREMATLDDVAELKRLLADREEQLKN